MDYYAHTDSSQPQHQSQRPGQQEQPQPYDLSHAHLYDQYYGYHHQRSAAAAGSSFDHYYYHPAEHGVLEGSQRIHYRSDGASAVPGDVEGLRGPYSTPVSLNPAAAAAVAALSQLVDTVDSASKRSGVMSQERWQHDPMDSGMRGYMMPPPQYPYDYALQAGVPHRGGGGRAPRRFGGRNGHFRGRGSGNKAGIGQRPPRSDGRVPSRSRGRGARFARGGGRRSQKASEMNSNDAVHESNAEPGSGEAHVSNPPSVQHQKPAPSLVWCDICRVSCNSRDILEQHKNGKRHKKTVHRMQEMQTQKKLLADSQGQSSAQELNEKQTQPTEAAQQMGVAMDDGVNQEAKMDNTAQMDEQITDSSAPENLYDALSSENAVTTESQVQSAVEQSDGKKRDDQEGKKNQKRKQTKFGRGGKRLKTSESMSRRHARPREQPRICTLCNVMCETHAVFDSHIAGKKHCSRIKRFQGDAVYGPLNVYIPPNQPSLYDTSGPEPLYFGLQTQGMVPLPGYEPQQLSEADGVPQLEKGGQAISTSQLGQPHDQNTGSASEVGKNTVAAPGSAPGNAAALPEPALAPAMDSEAAIKTEDAAEEEIGPATGSGILGASEVITAEDVIVEAEMNSEEKAAAQENGTGASTENVIPPGLDNTAPEPNLEDETANQDGGAAA